MLKISFIDVGQGDSIILEWEEKGEKMLAIIDCKKHRDTNPVLEYVKDANCKHIAFMLMSHPHFDHSSGFYELINYCLEHDVKIEYFLHTNQITPAYYRVAVEPDTHAEIYLLRLLSLMQKCAEEFKFELNNIEGAHINPTFDLTKDLKLNILAPTSREFIKFSKGTADNFDDEEPGNKPNANWLSSLIKIYAKDWYVLLTSDSNKDVLIYYDTHKPEQLKGRMILGQSPHHGSRHNHNNTFWKKRKIENEKQFMVFSVGVNKHGHPSQEAVDCFLEYGYDIYSTNQVGALSSFKPTTLSKVTSSHVDSFGYVASIKRDKLNGNKVFTVDLSGMINLSM